jgi:uncharacterized protein GlcG (DUF336 family)
VRASAALTWLAIAAGVLGGVALPTAHAAPRRAGGGEGGASPASLLRAEEAIARKDWRAAESALVQAFLVRRRPEVLYQLGRLAEGEERLLDAQDLMRRYLTDPGRVPDEEAAAQAQRVVSLPRPPSGQVLVLGDAGALLYVDGRLVGDLPLSQPLLLAPGEHRVAVVDKLRRQESPVPVQSGRVLEMRFKRGTGAVLISLLPAVLWVPTEVAVAAEARNLLRDALEQAAGTQQQALLGREAALAQQPKLAGCLQTLRCQRELAQKNELDYILDTRIQQKEKPGSAGFAIEVRLWHALVDTPAAEAKKDCAACTAEQAAALLKATTTEVLAKGLVRHPALMTIESVPPGAEVLVGGAVAGTTPYKLAGWSGQVALTVRRIGYIPVDRTEELREGESQSEVITLLPTTAVVAAAAVSKPPPRRRPMWRLISGGALIATGVLIGGFGISGLAVDGKCYYKGGLSDCPAGGIAPHYETTALGGGLLGAGLGLAIVGSGMLAWPAR